MWKIQGYLIFFIFFTISLQKKTPHQKITLKGDHFFSQTQKSKTYVLEHLQSNKPLLVFLKKKNQQYDFADNIDNKITMTISDNQGQQQNCQFISYQRYCLLKNVKSKQHTKIKIQCEKTPCDVTFQSIQAQTISPKFNQLTKAQTFYKIQKKDVLVSISCSNPEINDFNQKIKLYSNSNYTLMNQGNIQMYFFEGLLQDLVLIKQQEVQKCTSIKFQQQKNEAQYNKVEMVMVNKIKQIKVLKSPSNQLRLDLNIYQIYGKQISQFNISFFGIKDNVSKQIQTFKIQQVQDSQTLDLNLIIKKQKFQGYPSFSFKIIAENQFFIHYNLEDVVTHSLDIQEQSYFNLDKDQKVQFDIVGSKQNQKQKIQAILLDQQRLKDKVNLELKCNDNTTCKLFVTAKQRAQIGVAIIYKRQQKSEFEYIPIYDMLQLTLHEGEIRYLLHNDNQSTSKTISVSSSNILIYAAGQKCPKPSSQCYEHSGNLKHSLHIQNSQGPLYIAVQSLDLTTFVIRINDKNGQIQLIDGVPLTVNIEKQYLKIFKFRIKQKQTVNFNLIAASGLFQMYVSNSQQQPDIQDLDLISSTGYIQFKKSQIEDLSFTILIKSKIEKPNQRFTIIASTKSAVILLDKSDPHYDLMKSGQKKKYSILVSTKQIKQKVQAVLSIDIFQKLSKYNLTLKLGKSIDELDKQISITKAKSLVNIHEYTNELCEEQQEEQVIKNQCFLYLELTNQNTKQIDITLNYLQNNSIIQLTPGIWQSYELSSLTGTNHFYFTPNNLENPIYLMFSHSLGAYKLNAILFDNKQKIHNPGFWPFPQPTKAVSNAQKTNLQITQITIQTKQIKKCFPDCILLISLENANHPKSDDPNIVQPIFYGFGTYSIMATDSVVQIVESQKIPISLSKFQQKVFIIPITKYLKAQKTLTFITSDIFGYHIIFASLTTNRLQNLPTQQSYDFKIIGYQTQLNATQINQKLKQKDINSHQQVDLLLSVKCPDHCKFIFQFTSKQQYLQQLYFGFPNTVTLEPHSKKMFSINYYLDHKIKFTRIRGFPIIKSIQCNINEIQNCYSQLQLKQSKPMTSKTNEIPIKHVFATFTLLQISSNDDNIQIQVVAISNFTALQLKQGVMMTDSLAVNSTNRYKIHTTQDQDIIITITIFEGNPTAILRDPKNKVNKTKTKTGNSIQFHVYNAKNETQLQYQLKQQEKEFIQYQKQDNQSSNSSTSPISPTSQTSPTSPTSSNSITPSPVPIPSLSSAIATSVVLNKFSNSQFSQLSLEISDTYLNASYSIVYTLGERHIDLYPGILNAAHLKFDETITYNYINFKNKKSIVTITFSDHQMLNACQITVYSYSVMEQSQPVQSKPERLKSNSKTPKPSISFELNQKDRSFQIKLKNKKQKQIDLSITVNHVDNMAYLPLGYEYPNYLEKNTTAYFIIQILNKGYIQVIIKKCSQTDLTFSYAVHDDAFLNQQYGETNQIQENLFISTIKAQQSRLYLKLDTQLGAIFSIQAIKYQDKKDIPKSNIKPGDRGQLSYKLLENQRVQVSFSPVVCKKQCGKLSYYYLLSNDRNQVNTQVACPGNFFLNSNSLVKILVPKIIKYTKSADRYTFQIDMPQQISYLGLKAISDNGYQVAYRVVELQTYWDALKKNQIYHFGILGLLLFCFVLILCLLCRRQRRMKQKYDNLPENQS